MKQVGIAIALAAFFAAFIAGAMAHSLYRDNQDSASFYKTTGLDRYMEGQIAEKQEQVKTRLMVAGYCGIIGMLGLVTAASARDEKEK